MGLREGWTQDEVDQILTEHKELFKIAAEQEAMFIPPWLDDNDLREYLIEQYMVNELELTEEQIMEKVEETLKWYKEFMEEIEKPDGNYVCITAKQYDLALTDPDALREDLMIQYKRTYPEETDEWIKEQIEEEIESLKIGALKRLERMKKIEVA